MSFEELIARYRDLALWRRFALLALLAIAPAAYDLWDHWEMLQEERALAAQERLAADKKFKEALKKREELPALEQALASKEAEMNEASNKLPDVLFMDQILQKTELIAQELGVSVKVFDPGEEVPSETAFKYLQVPIKLDLVGSYGQIASFFDHLVHLEILVHIENFSLRMGEAEDVSPEELKGLSDDQIQELKRAKTKIRATCDMVVFRTLTEKETLAVREATVKPAAGGKQKK